MNGNTKAVPPIEWWRDRTWDDNFTALEALWDEANGAMCGVRGLTFQPVVDELAILMPTREMVMEFVTDAVAHGWRYFNASADLVRAEPFGTTYGVWYHFLDHPGKPWRLEIMQKGGGVSPLHDALSAVAQNGFPVVHASFKPANGESYQNYALEQAALNDAGYALAQECNSTYGRFGYWRMVGTPQAFYLKPRINTRDSIMHSMCTIDSHDGCMS